MHLLQINMIWTNKVEHLELENLKMASDIGIRNNLIIEEQSSISWASLGSRSP